MFWMRNKENNFPIRTLIWRNEIYMCQTTKFQTRPRGYETFLCSTEDFYPDSDGVFILQINDKMSTIVGILIFISMINFMLSCVELDISF